MSGEINPIPKVVVDPAATEQGWLIDGTALARRMSDSYGISSRGIERTAIILGGKNHISYKGSETPGTLDRCFRGANYENQDVDSVIRIATTLKGAQRSPKEVNETLSHELEHTAQGDRRDRSRLIGNIAIWGLAAVGSIIASRVGKHPASRVASATIGGMVGQYIGYRIAPHENQARQRAKRVQLVVITKRSNQGSDSDK